MICDLRMERAVRVSITGEDGKRLFATEIHKKKFLDAVQDMTEAAIHILGYCVLDQESILLMSCQKLEEEELLRTMIHRIMTRYEERLRERAFDLTGPWRWTVTIQEISGEDIWDEILRLHYYPVQESYTVRPEDYWWSSCAEYLGRDWMHYNIPNMRNQVREIRSEHREWKKKHPEIYKREYNR